MKSSVLENDSFQAVVPDDVLETYLRDKLDLPGIDTDTRREPDSNPNDDRKFEDEKGRKPQSKPNKNKKED